MNLQEEYFDRKNVPAHLIRYPNKGTLFLKSKKLKDWIQLSITYHPESQHPPKYLINVAANPIIYASTDFSQSIYKHSKVLLEEFWEWDVYEKNLISWVKKHYLDYEALSFKQAIFSSWEMFLQNYDSWLANFLPCSIIDLIADSLENSDDEKRLENMFSVESWMQEKHDRFYSCWKNIKVNLEKGNYADWLAKVINNFDKKHV